MKCFRRRQQPGVCKPCVVALGLVLIGWLVSCLLLANSIQSPLAASISTGFAAICMSLFGFAALGIAITGLVLYDTKVHRTGRTHAVWAIALALVFSTITIFCALNSYDEASWDGLIWSQHKNKCITAVSGDCSIEIPLHWDEIRPESLDRDGCLALRRSKPNAYAIVIAQKTTGEANIDKAMEVATANLAATLKSMHFEQMTHTKVDNQHFLRHTCLAESADPPHYLYYCEQWITVKAGRTWQISLWGATGAHKDVLVPQFIRIAESFRILHK